MQTLSFLDDFSSPLFTVHSLVLYYNYQLLLMYSNESIQPHLCLPFAFISIAVCP